MTVLSAIAREPGTGSGGSLLGSEAYRQVNVPIAVIFGGYVAAIMALAAFAWSMGQASLRTVLVFGVFIAVNVALSAAAVHAARRLRIEAVRLAAGALLAPAAYVLAGDPFMRWWPGFLIMCLAGVVIVSLHASSPVRGRLIVAYYAALFAAAEGLAPAPHDWHMFAINLGAIAAVGLLFCQLVALLGRTLASEREQRVRLAAEKARSETMLQQEAANALRESEAHHRALLENAFDITAIVGLDGTYRSLSPNYEEELGWSAQELVGRPFAPLIHPDDQPMVMEGFVDLVAGRIPVLRVEIRIRHKDGGWRWIEAVGQRFPDGSIVSKARNITARKEAEEALQRLNAELEQRVAERTAMLEAAHAEQRRMAAIIEATSDYVGIADLQGRGVYVNESGLRLVGKRRVDMTGANVAYCYPPGEMEKIGEMIGTALAGGIWSGETTLLHADGREIPVSEVTFALPDAQGRPEYVATIIRDISAQKRAEERIRESEEKFRSLTELSSDWYWEQDGQFRFTSFAGGGLQDTNVDYGSLIGKTRWELDYDGVDEAGWVAHRALLAEHRPFRDFVMQRRDAAGEMRYLSVSGAPVFGADGKFKGYRGIGREITARMRVEKDLERQLALFQALIDTMPASVAYKDRDLRFLGCNRAHQEFFGPGPRELAGKTIADLEYLPQAVRDQVHADDLEVLRAGQTVHRQYELRDRHGVLRPVLHWKAPITLRDGTHIGLLGVVVDISDEKRAKLELQRAKEAAEAALAEQNRLTEILEATSDFVGIADAQGRVVYINRAGRQMIGLDPGSDLRELDFSRMFDADTSRRIYTAGIPAAMRDGAWQTEVDFTHASGRRIPTSFVGLVHKGPDGAPALLSCIARDITGHRKADSDLRQAKEAAEAANRAKSAFLANMSHEIRTPMNAVIGMTSLLLETPLTPRQRDFVETVRASGDALLTVINDILDFSKIEADRLELAPRPFMLRESVEAVLDLLAPRAAEKGLEIAYLPDEGVPAGIVSDVTRLRQILVNLVGNAIKFTAAGEIVVSASSRPLPATAGGPARVELQFAVRDTGPGVPAQKRDRLFQSFSQLDSSATREHGGTGLGLAISRRLAELMGGRMWVESEGVPGKGSTFLFTIEAECADSVPGTRLRSGILPELRGRRILIVDDNATNRRILELQARSWGMQPVLAASAAEALAHVRSAGTLDLAILDMQLPAEAGEPADGVALAQEICALRGAHRLPLVMLTSVGSAARREAEAVRCFEAWLTKPVKPSQLYNVLIEALAPGSAHLAADAHAIAPVAAQALAERLPLRILLAEDVALNQKFALLAFEQMGYRADVAANGLEAIAALERQPYDVVFMDVQMPVLDGLEATRRIRASARIRTQPTIIAMTANAMQGDREACLQAGMDDYVSKPVYLDELRAALERAAQGRAGAPAALRMPAVEELLGRKDGADLVALYLKESARCVQAMRSAVQQGDARALGAAAHALKGCSGYVGADPLVALCLQIEQRSRAGSLEGAAGLVAAVEREIERVREALDDLCTA